MNEFSRTDALLQDNQGIWTPRILLGATVLLGAWLIWAFAARISLYAVSVDARVERANATYAISSPFLGRVVRADLAIGRSVRRGDLLVELDSRSEQLQLAERRAEQAGLAPQIERLRARIAAERGALGEEQGASRLATEEAARRAEEARVAADTAGADAARMRQLQARGLVSVRELERAEADARMRREAAAALATAGQRLPREQRARDNTRSAHLAELEGQLAALVARQAAIGAEVERLGYEIERRGIRAPVDGRIGEAAILRPGAVVDEAQPLGSIVPEGELAVVAYYPAQAAVGRIEAGQRAVLRLDAFPWAEFGVVDATVTQVAREVRDGKVRVELSLDPSPGFRGRLDHGMPGSIEVAVERVSPMGLVLRTAGQWFTQQP